MGFFFLLGGFFFPPLNSMDLNLEPLDLGGVGISAC